ncbi:MAG: inositol monophosphatase family protein [Acidimicrobiales bacterium]
MSDARQTDLAQELQLEAVAVDVARLAADHVRSRIGAARAAHTKSSPTDIVTDTDLETERLIRHELKARSPRSSIVGEELADQHGDSNVGWIVDPIDGTINFLYNLPVVSVSVAATLYGTVVAGAVTDVLLSETFSATTGRGARSNGVTIAVSGAQDLANSLIGTGFSYDAERRADEATVVSRILPAARDIRCFGSAALQLCWVGCGRLDACYQRGLKIYDYAAGALIATEAGAEVEQPTDNGHDLLLATTPRLLSAVRDIVVGSPDR